MTNKMTFAAARKEVQAQKNNSDLENLAHALEYLSVRRKELNTLEADINKLATRIESGEVVEVGEVRKLYGLARSNKSL